MTGRRGRKSRKAKKKSLGILRQDIKISGNVDFGIGSIKWQYLFE